MFPRIIEWNHGLHRNHRRTFKIHWFGRAQQAKDLLLFVKSSHNGEALSLVGTSRHLREHRDSELTQLDPDVAIRIGIDSESPFRQRWKPNHHALGDP